MPHHRSVSGNRRASNRSATAVVAFRGDSGEHALEVCGESRQLLLRGGMHDGHRPWTRSRRRRRICGRPNRPPRTGKPRWTCCTASSAPTPSAGKPRQVGYHGRATSPRRIIWARGCREVASGTAAQRGSARSLGRCVGWGPPQRVGRGVSGPGARSHGVGMVAAGLLPFCAVTGCRIDWALSGGHAGS
jgi:hypothetical protein